MRLDKYLQLSGIIPRRTRAQQACLRGYVELDGRSAKPSSGVSVGDRITVRLGGRRLVYEILAIPGHTLPRESRREAARLVESMPIRDD